MGMKANRELIPRNMLGYHFNIPMLPSTVRRLVSKQQTPYFRSRKALQRNRTASAAISANPHVYIAGLLAESLQGA